MIKSILLVLIFLITLVLCVSSKNTSSVQSAKANNSVTFRKNYAVTDIEQKWEKVRPESQGIDSKHLIQMMEELKRSNQDIDGIVIIRNKFIVQVLVNT